MSKRWMFQWAVVAALLTVISVGSMSRVFAQKATQGNHFQFQQTDVRLALREVFKTMEVSYTIAPDVQGTVTVDLRNVSIDTALQNVLRQVGATYRIQAGVYEIIKREPPEYGIQPIGPDPRHPMLPLGRQSGPPVQMIQDGRFIYMLMGDSLEKIEKSSFKVVKTLHLGGPQAE